MLDIDTLRVVQASVAFVVFLLVRFGTYRHTRSPYALGWSWVVVLSGGSTVVYLLEGPGLAALAAPLGNGLSVASAGLVWASARALRAAAPRPWAIVLACVAVTVASVADGRTDGTLPGTPALLAGMTLMFALAARELWVLTLEPHLQHSDSAIIRARPSLRAMVVTATFLAAFYGGRLVTFAVLGPDSSFYSTWAGPTATTFVILVVLVVVTFTITALSRFEATTAWQLRASRDDLTELLARHAFEQHYVRHTARRAGRDRPPILVLADLDDFKTVNDTYGHDEGDRVLRCLADALRETLTDADVACRWGGDEFVVMLADTDPDAATRAIHELTDAFAARTGVGTSAPSVSFGVAHARPGQSLAEALEDADWALRGAKDAGRSRIVVAPRADAG
ncbi:diguanylate cyclase [Demequina sp. SO4-18]|uniref:GGDEF domain-containing protein n=1 Tax=Demequina sp. SO4-18 TaxID=3401026 RepID=UPI003B5B4A14